jgi:glycerol-3-phosphate dehydrogenase (NAD(P)+)
MIQYGVIGSGSWATAITKILTDNKQKVNWWVRNEESRQYLTVHNHNAKYLSSVYFHPSWLTLYHQVADCIADSTHIVLAVPAAHIQSVLQDLPVTIFQNKKIITAIKGILPQNNVLLNDYLQNQFNVPLQNYFAVMGPCHAEEVASEKLSYLTLAGIDEPETKAIANSFKTNYITTKTSADIIGVQYAAVLKNIYAVGAGIAHGLDYGDNFLSVLIANSAREMANFLRAYNSIHKVQDADNNYAASVYLGDLLVTCYSLYSRNRTFGNMIGKGYSIRAAQIEMNMVAEGYNASKCMNELNKNIGANIPIAHALYKIIWENAQPRTMFKEIEKVLV